MAARLARCAAALAVIMALAATPAAAEPAAGVTVDKTLVLFDTATPGTVTPRPITGLQAADEVPLGIDLRPATGELFLVTAKDNALGMASVTRTYRVDPATGGATFVGVIQDPPSPPANAGDAPSGIDFNPAVDRIRLVNSTQENMRINPASGGVLDDVDLTYTGPADGPVTGLANDRNVAPGPPGTPAPPGTKTTVYGIDVGADTRLVAIGGIDGSDPSGPNGGAVTAVGPLGVATSAGVDAGFDISRSGTAYAVLAPNASGPRSLYTVNLQTGAATLVGSVPLPLISIAIFPPDNCPTVSGDDQADLDGDGIGDACDSDIDGDGVSNDAENARGTDPRKADSDGDAVPDGADACPDEPGDPEDGCDDTEAKITLGRVPGRMKRKRFFSGVVARFSVSEPVDGEVALLGRARTVGLAKVGDVVLAQKAFGFSAKARAIKLKARRKLVGRKKRFSVRLRITAVDGAGNVTTKQKTIRVRG